MQRSNATRRILLLGLVAAVCLVLPHAAAHADALDDAKATGQLGERYDGYLGAVSDAASAATKALAADINTKRKAHYGRIAASEGTSVTAVAAIAGKRLVSGAPSGQFVQPAADAPWKQIP